MKTHRRSFAVLALLAVVALALTSVALAGSGRDNHHKRNHKTAQQVKKVVKNEQVKRHPTFAPTKIIGAPEASAVLLDPLTHQFVQVTFDRGRVTAATSNSITLEQHQGGVVWRTQTFTVAAAPTTSNTTSNTTASTSALVSLNGHGVQLTQIPIGSSARVESTGTPGGAMSVVRVQAFSHGEAPLPATS